MFYTPRTDLEPQLTVIKPTTSPVLSPTLLQIYCIGLIGPIPYSIWVWATNCDPTITIQKKKNEFIITNYQNKRLIQMFSLDFRHKI